MRPVEILVVAETPSLGRSVADLLDSEGYRVRLISDLSVEAPLYRIAERNPVVVVASNGYFCSAARRYANGEVPNVTMVVVGSRDPVVSAQRAIRSVELPIQVGPFLGLVRALLADPSEATAPRRAGGEPGPTAVGRALTL